MPLQNVIFYDISLSCSSVCFQARQVFCMIIIIVHTVGYPHAKYHRPNPFCIEMSSVLKIGTHAEISLVSPATSERALSLLKVKTNLSFSKYKK